MKTPTDPKEEVLQQLAKSLLRDFFAAAALAGVRAEGNNDNMDYGDFAATAFKQSAEMLARSHTPALIEQLSKLKS